MPDPLFADPRLAPLYDTFEGDRTDLAPYLALMHELGARTVLDIGCGTGTFAVLAAAVGARVTGVDPAVASLEVARGKPGADRVTWHAGTVTTAPPARVDLALMTGNVAQVFLDDAQWLKTLAAVRDRLAPHGRFAFETRRPEARAWEGWAAPFEASWTVTGVGLVRQRRELLDVTLPLVRFRWRYELAGGERIDSDSTVRFRDDEENRHLLRQAGLSVVACREAADRPGQERVYLTRSVDG
ncbi:class I SAM-dependent methyltransferase [Arsenicicoccus dermatophilus]|uniref:class I SAM-dependent methyltransferase n=1 Tax=Arsenicicoccus dermatophilus TaxID=1076331 RepID=UPI0039171265